MTNFKKVAFNLFLIFILLLIVSFPTANNNVCFAESKIYKICVSDCAILIEPNSSLENNVLEVKSYGQKIKIDDVEIEDLDINSSLKFYAVLDDEEAVIGYVLASSVINENEKELNVKLQTNAKLNADSEIFALSGSEYVKLKINNVDISLQKDSEIRLLEKYDKNKTYSQISFYYNNEIYTGYVLTSNIQVSGFNYYFLIAIFLIVIIASTVIPIVVKNWKKNRKLTDR